MSDRSRNLFTYETLVHAMAGAAGSVVAMGTFYPLDTVRARLQLEDTREAKNTLSVLRELVAEEGFCTLYRGMVPVLESLCASNFVYFYTFHGLKGTKVHPVQHSAVRDLLLGSVAGVVNVLLTTPLWVVNTRLKMKGVQPKKSHESNGVEYTGLIDGLMRVARNEGLGSLWSGTLPSLLLVVNPALQFMVYESLKRHMRAVYGPTETSGWVYFLMGAVAKAVATILTYPLQIVQTKLRHGHNFKDLTSDAGMIEMTLYLLRKHGVGGLFKGMESKLLQTVLTAALMFATYEKIAAFVFKLMLSHQQTVIKRNH
ncbi:peroxisomal membrane protein PMP34-like [Schistocerca piceifrons]|uniref:peroxisomal membrane protein PMP34-like n=1 Tax=Schistocerca piceifrons TaxID=274613 RepID=UPI001F5F44DD|nr:peroxisomal membrane protein PMP34-like [Schistocerca piceifrons]